MQPGGALANIFAVAEAETAEVSNPYWEELERSGDAQAYAKSYTAFVRAFAESTLQQHFFAGGESSPEQSAANFSGDLKARSRRIPNAAAIAAGFYEWGWRAGDRVGIEMMRSNLVCDSIFLDAR